MSPTSSLLQTNIDALHEGAALLDLLNQDQYTLGFKPAFHSNIGVHFRHVLEHYLCFLEHLESAVVCYDSRPREPKLEADMNFAQQCIGKIIVKLQGIDVSKQSQSLRIADQQSSELLQSSLDRELVFLQSHTVHHYAIIGAIARAHGVTPADDFGIAVATRSHQANLSRRSACAQ